LISSRTVIELGVAVRGHAVQALDHAQRVEDGTRGLAADVGHPEEFVSLELLLDVGDDVQQFAIGCEKVLEGGVSLLEEAGHILLARWLAPPAEAFEEIHGRSHAHGYSAFHCVCTGCRGFPLVPFHEGLINSCIF
jgi:hypothetical protein